MSGCAEALGDEIEDDLVGDQLPLVDELLGARAERRVRLDGRAQHVAGRDVRDLEDRGQPLTACVPFPAPGGPNSKRFSLNARLESRLA